MKPDMTQAEQQDQLFTMARSVQEAIQGALNEGVAFEAIHGTISVTLQMFADTMVRPEKVSPVPETMQ